jgi:hypothetical protein
MDFTIFAPLRFKDLPVIGKFVAFGESKFHAPVGRIKVAHGPEEGEVRILLLFFPPYDGQHQVSRTGEMVIIALVGSGCCEINPLTFMVQ